MTDRNPLIRPIPPTGSGQRIEFAVGQIWAVDDIEWFVLTDTRIIALFSGGDDHTPESLYHVYGDRLSLRRTATVYARSYHELMTTFRTAADVSSCGSAPTVTYPVLRQQP